MKRAFLVSLIATVAHAATVTSLVFTWQANPLNAGKWPACSAAVTTACLQSQTLTDVTSGAIVAANIPIGVFTVTITPLPAVGTHTWALVYNAIDQSGNPVVSSPDQYTGVVPSMIPNHPVDLKGGIQ